MRPIAVLVIVSVVAAAVAAAGVAGYFVSTNAASKANGILQGSAGDPTHLTLHSVAYVEASVNKTLLVPSSSAVSVNGASLKMLGVLLDNPAPDWMVTIYYSNQTFVNGSTTIDDILSNAGGIAIVESPAPAGVNDTAWANQATSSAVICQSNAGSSQCTSTYAVTKNVQLTTQNGVEIIINAYTPELGWLDNQRLLYIDIVGGTGASVSQLLVVSNLMTK